MNQRSRLWGWVPVTSVISALLLVYVSWLTAFLQLGRRPIPSMDDPKFLGGYSSVISSVCSKVILALLLCWAASLLGMIVFSLLPKTEDRAYWWKHVALGLAAMFLLFGSAHYSPGDAVTWFLD